MPQPQHTVLVIEDEMPIRRVLTISLEMGGYKVVECDSGREGVRLAAFLRPDIILLDLGLPDIDGKEVIRQVREWSQMPMIVCSARIAEEAISQALELGADDYVSKPFNPDVLLARIRANLRKLVPHAEAKEPELVNGSIRMDTSRHEVQMNGEKVTFTPKEYELLRYFLTHCGKMLTHRDILKAVWGSAHMDDMQYLRVYVRQLREKIERHTGGQRYIITEPGIGYRMEHIGESAPVCRDGDGAIIPSPCRGEG